MAIDFPNSPTTNQEYTVGSIVWRYDGEKWIFQALTADPLSLSDSTPLVESGSGLAGTSGLASRSDHVHPSGAVGDYLLRSTASTTYLAIVDASATYLTQVNASTLYQPLDGDLTAIAGLAGTSGLLKKDNTNAWSLDTNTYLTTNQTITLSGDASGSGTTAITVTVSDDSHDHTGTTISALDTGDITTGTLAIARGGTGTGTTPTNGQLLIGNGTNYTLATLTDGTGITITEGTGSITIANSGVTSVNSVTGAVTATNLLDAIKTVDGQGSGLDSDLLAGNASAFYAEDIIPYSKTGTLTTGTGTIRYRFPWAATLLGVTAAVNTVPTGASIIADVNKNGTTIFTTQANRPTIAVNTNATSTEPTPDVTSMVAGDYLTVDIDQIGSTIAGADLTVIIRYRRT